MSRSRNTSSADAIQPVTIADVENALDAEGPSGDIVIECHVPTDDLSLTPAIAKSATLIAEGRLLISRLEMVLSALAKEMK